MTAGLPSSLQQAAHRSLVGGAGVLVLLALLAIVWPAAIVRSYLFAYTFWLNTSIGALGLLMLLHTTGGAWGRTCRRICEAAAGTLPWLAILGLPIILGASRLYPWADAAAWVNDPVLSHRRPWFGAGLVVLRATICFVIWIGLARALRRASLAQDKAPDHSTALALARRMRILSQAGIPLLFVTVSLMSVDWIMSREPHWVSSIFGLVLICGQCLSAMCLIILTLYCIGRESSESRIVSPDRVHDLGKLLLTMLVMWAYVMFSQYLIQWLGNTQEDVPWFVHRTSHGWQWVGAALIFIHLGLPLFLLLSRPLKRSLASLAAVALLIWVMRWVDTLWLVAPSSMTDEAGRIYWSDLLAPVGVSGVWIGLFLRQLCRAPLFPAAYVTSGANTTALIIMGASNVD